MTTEQKAKAYDETIEKLRDFYRDYDTVSTLIDVKEELLNRFPELQESEDELTWLTKYIEEEAYSLSMDIRDNEDRIKLEKLRKSIAWLEKQGEQKSSDKVYTFKAIPRLLEMIQPTDRAKSYCQKLIDSLEQEGYSADAKIVRERLKLMNGEKVAMATMDEQKHTGNVSEWSEEDEVKINRIVTCLENLNVADNDILLKDVAWLKSLKPKPHWKPSEEQMKWLKDVIETVPMTCRQQIPLESLYTDLKKLL